MEREPVVEPLPDERDKILDRFGRAVAEEVDPDVSEGRAKRRGRLSHARERTLELKSKTSSHPV